MKKINLVEDYETVMDSRQLLEEEVVELVNVLGKVCKESGLSYAKLNKALHQTDAELYIKLLYSDPK